MISKAQGYKDERNVRSHQGTDRGDRFGKAIILRCDQSLDREKKLWNRDKGKVAATENSGRYFNLKHTLGLSHAVRITLGTFRLRSSQQPHETDKRGGSRSSQGVAPTPSHSVCEGQS